MPRNLNKIEEETSKTDYYSEMGVSGLERYGGVLNEEWLNELSDLYRSNKVYKEMRDNDPIIGAILFASDMYIRKVKYYVKAGGISEKALKKAEFLESCLKDFEGQNLNDIISETLSFMVFGWEIKEKVYRIRNKKNGSKFDDNKVGWRRWGSRAQETLFEWKFDDNNNLIGMVQQNPVTYKYVFIPIEKLLLFRTKIYKDNPQGRSIFRNAFRSWWFKKHLEEFEAIGLEHSATNILIGWLPKDVITGQTDATLKSAFSDAIRKIQTGNGASLLMPLSYDGEGRKKYDLTVLENKGNDNKIAQIGAVIERYETRIAQTCLYEIMMIGTKGGGSYALAENKSNNFVMALGTFLDIIKEVINENAVKELFLLNGDDMEELPTLEFMPIVKADLKQVGEYLKNLADAGAQIWPNRALSKFIMEIANMPIPTDEELEENLENTSNVLDIDQNENEDKNEDEKNTDEEDLEGDENGEE